MDWRGFWFVLFIGFSWLLATIWVWLGIILYGMIRRKEIFGFPKLGKIRMHLIYWNIYF